MLKWRDFFYCATLC